MTKNDVLGMFLGSTLPLSDLEKNESLTGEIFYACHFSLTHISAPIRWTVGINKKYFSEIETSFRSSDMCH